MDTKFNRMSEEEITYQKNRIRSLKGWITKREITIQEIEEHIKQISVETFCGKEILSEDETENEHGKRYTMIMQFPNVLMILKIYPDIYAKENKYVVELYGEHMLYKFPDWYLEEPQHYEEDVFSFSKAQRVGLDWLEKLINRIYPGGF